VTQLTGVWQYIAGDTRYHALVIVRTLDGVSLRVRCGPLPRSSVGDVGSLPPCRKCWPQSINVRQTAEPTSVPPALVVGVTAPQAQRTP